ncbi:hypothetical protein GCM10022286_31290 [Gryllotalpicola daejeonensis]|uniref:HTH luxR-type domain-containing protein n=1 Tax=Gryllotalpicola daejeonensis TaxID=993087 RepID=A0ABP7ZNX8_9MICO
MEDGKLIGRSHELRFARQALESSNGLLITGVAGVGKTRFLAALRAALSDGGASVLLTNSANAVADLAELEARHPIIIVDDAHRLDPRLLDLLCTDAQKGAITLCLAGLPVSEVEPAQAAAIAPIVHAWLSGADGQRLRLGPLSGKSTQKLAAALAAPQALGPFWGEKIRRASGGLPALIKIYVMDAVRKHRLGQLPDLLDLEARELPPAEAIELLRPRVAHRDRSLLAALAVLGQLTGVSLDRAREVVRRGDITTLADAELLELRAEDDTLHVIPAIADVAASLLTAEEERTALERAAEALMSFAPDGRRSPIECVFLVRTWLRLDACHVVQAYEPRQVLEVLHSAARGFTRAGRAQQALALLARCPHAGGLGDAMTRIEKARAYAALHDHEEALAQLREAEPLVRTEREARMLLNRYNCVLVWHLGDPAAFAEVAARAQDWLGGSRQWARELALPGFFARSRPRTHGSATGALPTFVAALPKHRGTRASALAAGFLARALAGDAQEAEELLRMAQIEAAEYAGSGTHASALTATFCVRACLLMNALIRRSPADEIADMLRDVVDAAVALGGQSTQNLAFAKWFEALHALAQGDAAAARQSLECLDTDVIPERLQTWIEIEYARALACTGDLAEAHALVRRVAPRVRSSDDRRASFSLARARVWLTVAEGQPTRAALLARTIALRLEAASPLLAELVRREAEGGERADASAEPPRSDDGTAAPAEPAAPAEAGRPGAPDAPKRSAVITPIAPALEAAASKVLSGREIMIAKLAAAGRSNAQIASELFLSIRTVESHLHHARVKLGVTGRDGLAALFRDTAGGSPVTSTPALGGAG